MKAYGCRAGQVDVNRSDKSRLALNSFPVVYFFSKNKNSNHGFERRRKRKGENQSRFSVNSAFRVLTQNKEEIFLQ